jgi:hypothetical protein
VLESAKDASSARLSATKRDEAMALLRRAVVAVYRDSGMARDPDLDPLRKREDFRKLLADLTPGS